MARLIAGSVVGVCGEMTWPAVTGDVADLGWRLRYAPGSISQSDRLHLASIVDAYIQMVGDPPEKRDAVCREIVATCRVTAPKE
jgi:hypothetical protein